ncbi:MAG: protease modulator HflC [Wenzhouxiangellaceae bacterium]|nr:protease modulator HflC [Wenzhouxiangellaceae bacterium]
MKMLMPIALVAVVVLLFNSLFVVTETEHALKFRLGEVVRADYQPGLHFKTPFINNVVKFDNRLITLDMPPEQMNTAEQKFVEVDYYVKWQIAAPRDFYVATTGGDFMVARSRLAQLIRNDLRDEFARRTLSEVVSEQRRVMMDDLQRRVDERMQTFGIDVLDVRIKKIELTDEVLSSVFDRMATQRTEFANELRSLGRERAAEIQADADRETRVLLAEAERDAARIRGEGDARAAEIFASAYQRDPEFFAFMRSLEAYRGSMTGQRDMMVLDTESEFFRFFREQR